MRNQKGLTLSGFMTWAIIFAFVALLGFKLGPAYWENVTITKTLRAIASELDTASGTRAAVDRAFMNRTAVDNISAIGPKDIEISKDGGKLMLSANYTVRIPLVYNVSACMDFAPTSEK